MSEQVDDLGRPQGAPTGRTADRSKGSSRSRCLHTRTKPFAETGWFNKPRDREQGPSRYPPLGTPARVTESPPSTLARPELPTRQLQSPKLRSKTSRMRRRETGYL